MKEFLILQFDAPAIAFGGPMVDNYGVIQEHPAVSMIAGLLANALGLNHKDADEIQSLQDSLQVAARRDRQGEVLVDYQTVDLGQSFLDGTGWTTYGERRLRAGAAGKDTHIRYRHYRADCFYICALAVRKDCPWSFERIESALRHPARPLFLGRKCCLPSLPIFAGRMSADSLLDALAQYPRLKGRTDPGKLPAWWPAEDPEADSEVFAVTDARDWKNQIHCGRRFIRQGVLNPPEATYE